MKGLADKEADETLRAIKERRLEYFLSTVSILCGWKSLKSEDPELFRKILKVNTLRNDIMHGAGRLSSRTETIGYMTVLLDTLDWLRTNPFNFFIPPIARDNIASLNFSRHEITELEGNHVQGGVPPMGT